MAKFVTSNLQLGRPGAIKKYGRPFKNVDEMTEELIKSWNSVVSQGDIVYHLGNFAWDPKTAQEALQQLNGFIYLMPAERDEAVQTLLRKGMIPSNASMMNRITPLRHSGTNVTLSYWPMMEWPNSDKGDFSIIGYPKKKYKSDPSKRIINASCDLWNFKPQEINKLVSIFEDLG